MDTVQDTFQDQFLVGMLRDPGRDQGLHDLFLADMKANAADTLLRSGGPYRLSLEESRDLRNMNRALSFVAIDLVSNTTICHVSLHRKTTVARGMSAGVELVVTHPEFTGKHVAQKLMICAVKSAQYHWKSVRKVTLTSNESRVAARAMYTKLGFQLHGHDRFDLDLGPDFSVPWTPKGITPSCVAILDKQVIFTWQPRSDNLRNAILLSCKGDHWRVPDASWNVDPIGLYRYHQRPT